MPEGKVSSSFVFEGNIVYAICSLYAKAAQQLLVLTIVFSLIVHYFQET